jgi:glycerol-3-phosphate acyltransferase PlsY
MVLKGLLLFIAAFMIGGIPTGFIVTRVFHHKDIREHGSGNIGFTNVLRTAGVISGLSVLVVDAGKGFVVSYFFPELFGAESLFRLLFGITVILGNIFTPFLRFRGGKGVGTGLGVAIAVNPFSVIFALAGFITVVGTTKFVSLGSLLAAAIYLASNSIFSLKGGKDIYSLIFAFLLFIVIVLRHISNIKRLLRGEENRIGIKKR